jgi:urease accessory protein
MTSFLTGLLQPLIVPAHALALLALALLIGQQQRRLVPCIGFAVALAGGLAAISRGVTQTSADDAVLVAAALGGILVALAFAIPTVFGTLLAAIVGVALGLNSPPQEITLNAAILSLIGTWLGACVALVLVVMATSSATRDWQRIGVRILGSWIAASAMLVLALRYARGMLF